MSQSPQEPEAPRSAPAPHTLLVRHADDGMGLTLSHLLCAAPPAYVPAMPSALPDGTAAQGVLFMDLVQAAVGHECPPGTPEQTVGSLL